MQIGQKQISEIEYASVSLLSKFLAIEWLKHKTKRMDRVENSLKLFFHLAIEP